MSKLTRAKARDAVRAVKHKEYTTPLLAKQLGISPRKVQSMIERGYIKASVQAANGHPSKRIFNESDLKIARLALLFTQSGFTVKKIREVCFLLTDGDKTCGPALIPGLRRKLLKIDDGIREIFYGEGRQCP